jgi:hypothetical protein
VRSLAASAPCLWGATPRWARLSSPVVSLGQRLIKAPTGPPERSEASKHTPVDRADLWGCAPVPSAAAAPAGRPETIRRGPWASPRLASGRHPTARRDAARWDGPRGAPGRAWAHVALCPAVVRGCLGHEVERVRTGPQQAAAGRSSAHHGACRHCPGQAHCRFSTTNVRAPLGRHVRTKRPSNRRLPARADQRARWRP